MVHNPVIPMVGCLSIADTCVTWCADDTVEREGGPLLELEDVARKHPSITDIKVRWTLNLLMDYNWYHTFCLRLALTHLETYNWATRLLPR